MLLSTRLVGLAERPRLLQIETTSVCNLRCGTCPLSVGSTESSHDPSTMTGIVWIRVLASAAQVERVLISGFGEPFTDRAFLDRLRELATCCAKLSFSTNATLVRAEVAAAVAAIAQVDNVNVSIDAGDAETYRAVRGGDFARALAGLKILHHALESRLSVSVVATPAVAVRATELANRMVEVGRPQCVIQIFKAYPGRGVLAPCHAVAPPLADPPGILAAALRSQAVPVAVQEVLQPWTKPDPSLRDCVIPWVHPYIDKDGRVYACCDAAAGGDQILVDLAVDDLDDIWNGAAYGSWRQRLMEGQDLPRSCRGCRIVPHARHGLAEVRLQVESTGVVDGDLLQITVRNRGCIAWTRRLGLFLADPVAHRSSLFRHPRWMSNHYLTPCTEAVVPPGGLGTFRIPLVRPAAASASLMQFVCHKRMWLPGTTLRVAWTPETGFRVIRTCVDQGDTSPEDCRKAYQDTAAAVLSSMAGCIDPHQINELAIEIAFSAPSWVDLVAKVGASSESFAAAGSEAAWLRQIAGVITGDVNAIAMPDGGLATESARQAMIVKLLEDPRTTQALLDCDWFIAPADPLAWRHRSLREWIFTHHSSRDLRDSIVLQAELLLADILPQPDYIDAVYRVVLGRPVDVSGREAYQNRLRAGLPQRKRVFELVSSPEFAARFAPTMGLRWTDGLRRVLRRTAAYLRLK